MLYQPIIRKIVTGVMLLIFAFSVTPKKILHDVFANHDDPVAAYSKSLSFQVDNAGLTCKCENIFAQPIFTYSEHSFEIGFLPVFCDEDKTLVATFYTTTCFFFELRGPPATLSLS